MDRSMNDLWLEAAGEIRSYRHMYALAEEIGGHGEASAGIRKAARRVIVELGSIIDEAIGPAAKLNRARNRFEVLAVRLNDAQSSR